MKIGIDSYCFHRFFGEVYDGQPAPVKPMTMEDFLDFAVELGVDGVSLESCFFPSMEASWFLPLKARLDDYGLDRVYAWGHPTGLEDGTNRSALEDMVAQIGNAELIGAKVMRVTPGPGPGDWRYVPRQPRLEVLAGVVPRGGPRGRTPWGQAGGGEPRRLHRQGDALVGGGGRLALFRGELRHRQFPAAAGRPGRSDGEVGEVRVRHPHQGLESAPGRFALRMVLLSPAPRSATG